jgi:hypothetical protein
VVRRGRSRAGAGGQPGLHLVPVIRMATSIRPLYPMFGQFAQNKLPCSLYSPPLRLSEVSSLISSMFDTY